jgi:ABC-2 type transport system ATP-binding protein
MLKKFRNDMLALNISGLTKTYANELQALKGISLQVADGDFFALLGPNGAGKSTTIGIISSLVNKTAGKVYVFGHDLDTELNRVKACIGIVPQEINFNQFEKVIDIVVNQAGYYGIPRKSALEKADHYLNKLGLWRKRNDVSRSLSGGMKRRLMIARGLLHEPKMLILDEPTAGIDIELRRSTWEFLQEINAQGTTIILTTHYLEEAETLCNGIAIINHGEIVESTTVKQLLGKLQKETIVLDLERSIFELPEVLNCQIKKLDDKTIEVIFPKSYSLNTLFSCLSNYGINVMSMRNKSNRLEELFIDLISRKTL